MIQVIRNVAIGLNKYQGELKSLEDDYSEKGIDFSKNLRKWIEEEAEYLSKLVMESRFTEELDLLLTHFGKEIKDEYMKIRKMLTYKDSILMMEKHYETYMKDYVEKGVEIAEELYSDLSKFIPEKERKELK